MYAKGAGVVLTFTFEDANGTPTDPSSAYVQVMAPDGTVTEYTLSELTAGATGVYTLEVVLDQTGRWFYRAVGDGDLKCATPDVPLVVTQTHFTDPA